MVKDVRRFKLQPRACLGVAVCFCAIADGNSSSAAFLRAPATSLSWILGRWTCEAYNFDSGSARHENDLIRTRFVVGHGGLTVLGRSLADGRIQSDRMTWNEATSQWLDIDEASSSGPGMSSALTAENVDVNEHGMTFTGFDRMGGVVVPSMVVTKRTSNSGFTEETKFYEDGDWQTVERIDCRRDTSASP